MFGNLSPANTLRAIEAILARPLVALVVSSWAVVACAAHEPMVPLANVIPGYKAIPVPTDEYDAGAVVAVFTDPYKIEVVCAREQSVGVIQVRERDTVGVERSEQHTTKANLSAEALSLVKAQAGVENVDNIQPTLTNAKIRMLSDADIFQGFSGRTEPCRMAIQNRMCEKAGTCSDGVKPQAVTMLTGVVVADVVYKVDFKSAVTAETKVEALKKLGVTLGADSSTANAVASTIAGKTVHLAYVDQPRLVGH